MLFLAYLIHTNKRVIGAPGEISIAEVLKSGAIVVAASVSSDQISSLFKLIGELIGSDLIDSKIVHKQPTSATSVDLELQSPQGNNVVKLTDEVSPDITSRSEIKVNGETTDTTPPANSMTIGEASQWYRAQVVNIANMVNPNLTPANKAKEARKLRIEFLKGARAALFDPGLGAQFTEAFKIPSYTKVNKELAGQGLSGDPLFTAILNRFSSAETPKFPVEAGGCFPAGTKIWTDQGLVPIEQIKVGDKVLSQPEKGGEQAYKEVVRTFVHENKTLRDIRYQPEGGNTKYRLNATDNHPFWVVAEEMPVTPIEDQSYLFPYYYNEGPVTRKVIGWTRAADLLYDDDPIQLADGSYAIIQHFVQLADGSYAKILRNIPVFRTHTPGYGWTPYNERALDATEDENENIRRDGSVFDYINYKNVAEHVEQDKRITRGKNPYLKVRVYNFEVEDFHTYYVGNVGVWVHNISDTQGITQTLNKLEIF